jgi:hypothetical protein
LAENAVAAVFFAVPIKTKITHDRTQPGREAGSSILVKLAQAPKLAGRKLLANKEEAVRAAVGIAVKAPDNVIDQSTVVRRAQINGAAIRDRIESQ